MFWCANEGETVDAEATVRWLYGAKTSGDGGSLLDGVPCFGRLDRLGAGGLA